MCNEIGGLRGKRMAKTHVHSLSILVRHARSAGESELQHRLDEVELVELLRRPRKQRDGAAVGVLGLLFILLDHAGANTETP